MGKTSRRIKEPIFIELKNIRLGSCEMCIETEKEIYKLELDTSIAPYIAEKIWIFINRNQSILDKLKEEVRGAEKFN